MDVSPFTSVEESRKTFDLCGGHSKGLKPDLLSFSSYQVRFETLYSLIKADIVSQISLFNSQVKRVKIYELLLTVKIPLCLQGENRNSNDTTGGKYKTLVEWLKVSAQEFSSFCMSVCQQQLTKT